MMKSVRFLALALVLAISAPAAYARDTAATTTTAPAKALSSKQQVEAAFEAWLTAVSTGTPDAVEPLYAKDAVLLPTLAPAVHNTPALRHEYFVMFTAKKNLKGKVDESHIRVFGDVAVNSGLYTFTFENADGQTVSVPARYSFVYHKTPAGWLIVDHHSSLVPKG